MQLSLNIADTTDSLDPALQRSGNSAFYSAQVFEQLTRLDSASRVSPGIADRWTTAKGATQWTFHLRAGVRFSDGTPVTARDVAYTFLSSLDPKLGSGVQPVLAVSLDPDGVVVVDDRTIRFDLKAPNAIFDVIAGNRRLAIVKDGVQRPFRSVDQAIGCGPFRFTSFTPGEGWEMARNTHYWERGLPYLDGLRASVAPNAAALVRSLSGSSDMVLALDFASAKSVAGTHKLISVENAAFSYIVMDQKRAPFDDPRVVEALKLVVDREAVVRTAFQGFGSPVSDVLVPADSPFYPPSLGIRAQDIEKARSLLAAAGHRGGLEVEVFTAPFANGTVEYPTVYAEMAKEAGVNVKISQRDTATYFTEIIRQKPMYVSFVNNQYPAEVMGNRFTPNGVFPETNYTPPELTSLLARAVTTVDAAERAELYQEAWLLVADNAGMSVPASIPYLYGAKKNVEGVIPDSTVYAYLRTAYLA